MKIFYHSTYNIDLGVLNKIHPFDGTKFRKIYTAIKDLPGIVIDEPQNQISQASIDAFVDRLMQRFLKGKRYILEALELPYIPLLPYRTIDKKILEPMRWGVAGTIDATQDALKGENTWNLAGGYHHASRSSAQGFCIYNDIGIACDELLKQGVIDLNDRILIIDVDAHHGNGNAYVFMENKNVVILDIFNESIYPLKSDYTKQRVDIAVPISNGTHGQEYLAELTNALSMLDKLDNRFRLAYVIAGPDVLDADAIGGLKLSVIDIVTRDQVILQKLESLDIPAVFLGGGGYSKDSSKAITSSIGNLFQR